jgi:zinc/manganese transport system substrate-binding protein
MPRLLPLLLAALLALLGAPARAALRVVTTVPTLAAISREVVGQAGTVTSLALPRQDPHFVDARPNLALELARADALVLTGLELEVGWLPDLITGSRNAKVQPGAPGYIDASQHVTLLQVPQVQITRAMGDIHPGGNPHYHPDPRAARAIALALAERFAAISPADAAALRANAQAFVGRLDAAMVRWAAAAAPLKGRPVVDFHRSWPYLEDWLGFQIVADIEPKPGVPPTPKHALHVIQLARERGVKLIIQESWYPKTQVVQAIADQVGARVVVLDAQADFQAGQGYIEHVDALVQALLAGVR